MKFSSSKTLHTVIEQGLLTLPFKKFLNSLLHKLVGLNDVSRQVLRDLAVSIVQEGLSNRYCKVFEVSHS